MLLLQRNLILKEKKKNLQLHHKYKKLLLIWEQHIAWDAMKWTSPIGCFKEKLKTIIYAHATIKVFPEYLLH